MKILRIRTLGNFANLGIEEVPIFPRPLLYTYNIQVQENFVNLAIFRKISCMRIFAVLQYSVLTYQKSRIHFTNHYIHNFSISLLLSAKKKCQSCSVWYIYSSVGWFKRSRWLGGCGVIRGSRSKVEVKGQVGVKGHILAKLTILIGQCRYSPKNSHYLLFE